MESSYRRSKSPDSQNARYNEDHRESSRGRQRIRRSRSPTNRKYSGRSRSPEYSPRHPRSRSPRYRERTSEEYSTPLYSRSSPVHRGHRSRSPSRYHSHSPPRYRSRSPPRHRSRSPTRYSRSPIRRRSRSHDRRGRDRRDDRLSREWREREEANDKRIKEMRIAQDEYRRKHYEEKKNAIYDAKDMPPLYSIWRGTVKTIKEFGAFIDIRGFRKQGFLHISQISEYKVRGSEINDVIAINEEVHVKVISVDEEEAKYSVSLKYVNQTTGEDLDANLLKLTKDRDRQKQVQHFVERKPTERDEYVDMLCSRCGTHGHLAAECVVNLNDPQKKYDLISDTSFLEYAQKNDKKRKKKDKKEKKEKRHKKHKSDR